MSCEKRKKAVILKEIMTEVRKTNWSCMGKDYEMKERKEEKNNQSLYIKKDKVLRQKVE